MAPAPLHSSAVPHEHAFRFAGPSDARAIAALHADSWRRHYRGVYSDAFLDGDVSVDRLAVWTDRLGRRDSGSCTILADDESGLKPLEVRLPHPQAKAGVS